MAREIYAYKCRLCGTMHYPFRMVCKECRQNDFFEFDIVPLPKKGKLLTYTRVHNLPAEFEVPTLGLGIVELENGMRITGQLEADDPKIANPYQRLVKYDGNQKAKAETEEVFELAPIRWRGIAEIPASGYKLRPAFKRDGGTITALNASSLNDGAAVLRSCGAS